jgi:DNA polymerase III gamma/tau subunit
MKYLQNFEEFRNEVLADELMNEGIFSDALKSIWSFFKGSSKKFQDSITNFTKKIETQKGWDAVYKTTEAEITNLNQILTDEINNAQDVSQVRKSLFNFHRNVFSELLIVAKKMGPNDPQGYLTPIKLFNGTPFWKMYNFDKTQKFVNNLPKAIDALVLDMAGKSGFSKDEVQKSIKQYPNPADIPESTTTPPVNTNQQPTTNTTKQPTTPAPANTNSPTPAPAPAPTTPAPTNAGYILNFSEFNKLYEAGEQQPPANAAPASPEAGTGTNTTNQTNTNTNQQNKTNTTTDQNKTNTNQQTNTTDQNKTNQNTDMTKLKEQIITNSKSNFLGQIVQKKLKDFKSKVVNQQTTGANTDQGTESIAKSMKASNNLQTKKNILDAVKNSNKDTLKKIRDIVGGKDKLGAL